MPESEGHQDNPNSSKNHWTDPYFWLLLVTAVATSLAALFTRGQWNTAEDAERRQLRAYVGVSQHGIENFGEPTHVFKMTRKNYGSTPAYDIGVPQMTHDIIKIGNPLPFTYNIVPPPPQQAFTLFPGAEASFELRGNRLTRQQLDLVKNGTEFQVAYWGIIFYRDAFSIPHYTRFCWLFKGDHMTEKDADTCLGHNDSD